MACRLDLIHIAICIGLLSYGAHKISLKKTNQRAVTQKLERESTVIIFAPDMLS